MLSLPDLKSRLLSSTAPYLTDVTETESASVVITIATMTIGAVTVTIGAIIEAERAVMWRSMNSAVTRSWLGMSVVATKSRARGYKDFIWKTHKSRWTRSQPFWRRIFFDYLIRVRSSPPQIPSAQPSILMLDGPVSIRFPE